MTPPRPSQGIERGTDRYQLLLLLPGSLTTDYLKPLQQYAAYTINRLVEDKAFMMLPKVEFGAQNPTTFPRVVLVQGEDESYKQLKSGRPTKRDLTVRAKAAMDELTTMVRRQDPILEEGDGQHVLDNVQALAAADNTAIDAARRHVDGRLEELTRDRRKKG